LDRTEFQNQLSEVIRQSGRGSLDETRLMLASLRDSEIASLLESVPRDVRTVLWELIDDETHRRVIQYLHDDVLSDFLEAMDADELLAVGLELDTDDFADILQQLPETITEQVLTSMDDADRMRVESILSYPEDSAGGIMNTDMITVRPRHTVQLVLRYLRLRKDLPETMDALHVVNSAGEFVGVLPLSRLLTADPSVNVREIMLTEVEAIPVDLPDADVARLFSEHDLVSAPVVDPAGMLVGRITIDDVVDVILEDADEAMMSRAGLDVDDDTFAPILKSVRRRALWLGINLLTAFLAAAVINIFEETIAKVVALAVLMPIVASMGGIAGTQTLTLVIRGMATGQLGRANLLYLLNREFMVAVLNGLLLALLVAAAAAFAFQDVMLGGVIAIAMVVNLVVAGVAGSLLPSLLAALRIDPALAGGVVLTTVTDVTGFFVFLGLAAWAYG